MSNAFGPYLRAARKKAKLSLRNVADQAGISFTYLSKIETGVMPPPSEKTLVQLAMLLGLEPLEVCYHAHIIPSRVIEAILSDEWVYTTTCLQAVGSAPKKGDQ